MGNAFHFGYVEEHLYVFRETFTGNGAATTFQLTGSIGNATFETGSWTVVNVETAMAADASKTTGAALYDSLLPLVRHKITVSSISATGLVTLNYAPMAENFYIWYWYDMEGDAIQDYYRDDYVSSMEADAGVTVASGITVDVVGFAGLLDSNDNTVQKALDSLDDLTISSDNGVAGTVTAGNIKINTAQNIATAASPQFVTVKLTNLTDDYIPYHVNDATGLADGPTKTNVDSAISLKHAAITLDANADTLLSLSTQALGLDTQTANYALMGPVSGAAAVPTFRSPQSNEVIVPGGIGTPTYDDMQDFLRMTRSAGRLTGGVVSAHAGPDGTVDISEMEGMIFTTNALGGDYIYFKQAAATGGLALTDLSVNWVYFDWNAGTPRYLATVTRSTINEYNQFTVGRAWRSGNNVEVQATGHNLYDRDRRSHNRLILKYGGMDRVSGATISSIGATLGIQTDAGEWYVANKAFSTSAVTTFKVWYRSGSSTWVVSSALSLFSDVFDGAGGHKLYESYQTGLTPDTVGTLGAGRWGVYWVFIDPLGDLYVVMDDINTGSIATAQASTVPGTLPPYCVNWARLAGRIIIKKSDAAFYSVESSFSIQFALSSVVDHSSLYDLSADDHTQYVLGAAGGAAGQVLTYGGAARTAAWTTATYPATTTAFRLLVSTAANTVSELAAVGSAGQYLRGVTGAIPAWSTLTLPDTATAFKLAAYTATNVMTELVAVGATGEYLAGATGAIPAWATLNQAAVSGLTTASSPVFVTVKLSGLTDGYVPYHVADATGLANSSITVVGTTIGIESGHFDVGVINTTTGYLSLYGPLTGKPGGTIYYFLSGDYDDVIDTYNMYAYEDDFYIASNTGTIGVILKAEGDLQIIGGTLSCSDLTDGYVPYHVSDAVGLANSIISVTANDATVAGDLKVSATKKIYLDGGGDTYIHEVSADLVEFFVGAVEMITIIEGAQDEVRINEDGGDVDFTVEASGVADALIVLGANGQITLGALGAGLVYSDASGVLANKTLGIANANIPPIDDAGVADNEYAKFTANGLEGRAYADVLADIAAEPALGNPGVTGYVLSSTDAGVRSWIAPGAGASNPLNVGTDDDVPGVINIYGGGNTEAGGTLNFYTPNDQDGDNEFFSIGVLANTNDLVIGFEDDPDFILLDAVNKIVYLTDGSLYCQYGGANRFILSASVANGQIYCGSSLTAKGSMVLYGAPTGSNSGGTIQLETSFDNTAAGWASYYIQVQTDRLEIGRSGDLDAVIVDNASNLRVTGGSILIAGAPNEAPLCIYKAPSDTPGTGLIGLAYNTGASSNLFMFRLDDTTYDLYLDKRVGGAWNETFRLARATGFLYLGTDDAVKGELILYGDTAGLGGEVQLYAGATGDGTAEYWRVVNSGGAFYILDSQAPTATYAFSCSTSGGVTLAYTAGTVAIGQTHVTDGILTLYGDTGNNGGDIRLYNGDTADGTVDYWRLYASSGNLYCVSDTGAAKGGWYIDTAGSMALSTGNGTVYIGASDTVSGNLLLLAGAAGHGAGAIYLYLNQSYDSTIDYFIILPYDEDIFWQTSASLTCFGCHHDGGSGSNTTSDANSQFMILGRTATSAKNALNVYNSGWTNLLYVRNDGYFYVSAAWTVSDESLKTNIVELSKVGAKERIKALKPKKFDFIDGMKDQLGFVAQDVQSVIPEAVQSTVIGRVMDEKYKNARGDWVPELMPDRYGLAMNYTFLFPHIVSAIQEMSDDADALKDEIAALRDEIKKLKERA